MRTILTRYGVINGIAYKEESIIQNNKWVFSGNFLGDISKIKDYANPHEVPLAKDVNIATELEYSNAGRKIQNDMLAEVAMLKKGVK